MKKIHFLIFTALFAFGCGKKTNETKPVRKDITETVFASGTLEPENKYNLTAQSDGYIVELKFDYGDTVKAGQVLAVIDNKASTINAASAESLLGIAGLNASAEGPTLKQAQQNVELLRERSFQDSVQYLRYQKLIQSNSVSKLEFENARLAWETSKTNYLNSLQNYRLMKQQTEQQLIQQRSMRDVNKVSSEYNELKAVIGGRVYKRMKEAGDFVRRGDVIAVIGDASDMFAKLSVDEANVSKVKTGQEVILQLNTNKDQNVKGKVTEIYPFFDESTQSFYCKVKFAEDPQLKISGVQLQANIVIGRKPNALVIPKTFLDYGNKLNVKGKGPVNVQTGFVSGEWVEILSGVDENSIITSEH